jgi:hypothetical protein
LLAGVPPQVVAQLAGNSVAVIDRHYAHLHDDSLHRALAMADASPILEMGSSSGSTDGPKAARIPRRPEITPTN